MGTFMGHIVPGLALTLLGLWHTINSIRFYFLKTKFTVRFWYPFTVKLKYSELILILSFSISAIFMQIFDFKSLKFTFQLENFEHATMFLHLSIFAGFTLLTELTHSSVHILSGLIGILASSVFAQELFLLHFHSADHVGLEGQYHWLLQLIVFVSLLSSLSATISPTSFPAVLVLSISVVFQGLWFINMGFMLWFPGFTPDGCIMAKADSGTDTHGAVVCQSDVAEFRARGLANLQFSWIASGILIVTGCFYLKYAGKYTQNRQENAYEQINSRSADGHVYVDVGKQPHQ